MFPQKRYRALRSPLGFCCQLIARILWFILRHDLDRLHFFVRTPSVFGPHDRLIIGKELKFDNAFFNTINGTISIGDFSFFGQGCMVLTGGHDYTLVDSARQWSIPQGDRNISIGRGVWIGSGAIILSGVKIADHSVVAAGAIVTRSCEKPGIYAGVPAKLIKEINFTA